MLIYAVLQCKLSKFLSSAKQKSKVWFHNSDGINWVILHFGALVRKDSFGPQPREYPYVCQEKMNLKIFWTRLDLLLVFHYSLPTPTCLFWRALTAKKECKPSRRIWDAEIIYLFQKPQTEIWKIAMRTVCLSAYDQMRIICASKRGVCHLCLGRRFYYPYDGCAFVKTKRDIYPLSHLSITETRLSMRQLQCSLDAHYMCVKTWRLSLVSGSSFLLSIRCMCLR